MLTEAGIALHGLQPQGLPGRNYGDSPAAGAEFTKAIDSAYPSIVLSVFCKLVTDGNAGNREVVLQYRDRDGNVLLAQGAGTTIAASLTAYYSFWLGLGTAEFTVDSSALVPIAPFVLYGGESFKLHVVNIQATDQLSQIRWTWQQFIERD